MARDLLGTAVDSLQVMIRNQCVNDGTRDSGHEVRNADVIERLVTGPGIALERFEPHPGRRSLVARVEGLDPGAPSLCLNGHLDVVPAEATTWRHDPFGGELIAGEIWGRGAVDMLNLTATMAIAVRAVLDDGFRPSGDLVFIAAADEESGSALGTGWLAEHHPDAIACDYVLTESGGISVPSPSGPRVVFRVAEKGVAWRRLRVAGRSGHGSRPFRADNALLKAARVVARLAEYQPRPLVTDLWLEQLNTLDVDPETRALLADPNHLDNLLEELDDRELVPTLHACTHTTVSPNAIGGNMKTNVIPSAVHVDVDIRTLPGDSEEDIELHLRAALGDLFGSVEVVPLMTHRATASPADTSLWKAIARSVAKQFPGSRPAPQLHVGFTDARIHRDLGAIAYGAGLLNANLPLAEFQRRVHGADERIDVDSLDLTMRFWMDVITDFLA